MQKSVRIRLTADGRRAQLVDEAEAMIAQDGFSNFSIAGLAERAGISRAGVLHHFAGKEDKERESAALTSRYISDRGTPDARAILDLLVRHNIERPEVIRLFSMLAAESIAPEHPAHEHFKRRLHRGAEQLEPLLTGYSRSPQSIAVQLLSFMDGMQLNWLRDPSLDLWEHWTGFADAYFEGLARTERDSPAAT
jgi:AcrR family transcriptional regulator